MKEMMTMASDEYETCGRYGQFGQKCILPIGHITDCQFDPILMPTHLKADRENWKRKYEMCRRRNSVLVAKVKRLEKLSENHDSHVETLEDCISWLQCDVSTLREAGMNLALAAIHVVKEYDGLHRLSLAVSKWMTAVANEGGRGNKETRKHTNE